jgi:hypothetical protein
MCVAHHPRLRQHGIRSPTSALGGMLRGGMPRVPSMSIALAFCALSSFPVASGFRAAGIGAFGCANRGPPVARWTCEAKAPAASESYTIVPSQLAESGGGWTIQGVKPVAPTPTLRKVNALVAVRVASGRMSRSCTVLTRIDHHGSPRRLALSGRGLGQRWEKFSRLGLGPSENFTSQQISRRERRWR